jgi:hypothetical protein
MIEKSRMQRQIVPDLADIPHTVYDCEKRGPHGECNYDWGIQSHYTYCTGVRGQIFGDWPKGGCPKGFP